MKTQLITIITIAILALAGPSLAGTTDRDYGVLPIPADASAEALAAWQACSETDQGDARSALRLGQQTPISESYLIAPGHGGDEERLACFSSLIRTLGGTVLKQEGHYASDRLRWERAETGEWVEVEGPLGYRVTWAQRTDGCEATVWGVLGPPKPGTPWYLNGAPSMRLPCEVQ